MLCMDIYVLNGKCQSGNCKRVQQNGTGRSHFRLAAAGDLLNRILSIVCNLEVKIMQLALNHVNWDLKCILRCGAADGQHGKLVEDLSALIWYCPMMITAI